MTLWVTGAAGLLGSYIARVGRARGWTVVASGRDIDIADIDVMRRFSRVSGFARSEPPHCIVNCAAWTAVDDAESNPAACWRINATGAAVAARVASESGASLVHMSTDYVFGGEAPRDGAGGRRAWREDDQVAPLSVYGASKAAGEFRALDGCERAAVVRSSWLFAPGGADFVAAVYRRLWMAGWAEVVDDQVGCPTSAPDLAEAMGDMLALPEPPRGIIHLGGDEPASWYGFACAIRDCALTRGLLPAGAEVRPTNSRSLARPARRPAWSVLSTEKATALLGRGLPSWRSALPACLEETTP